MTAMHVRAPRCGTAPIQTLRPGEFVTIHLRAFQVGEVNGYGGRIVDADCKAIRLDLEMERLDLYWQRHPSRQIVIPWARVDEIVIGQAT